MNYKQCEFYYVKKSNLKNYPKKTKLSDNDYDKILIEMIHVKLVQIRELYFANLSV
jgi:hypothetical protein